MSLTVTIPKNFIGEQISDSSFSNYSESSSDKNQSVTKFIKKFKEMISDSYLNLDQLQMKEIRLKFNNNVYPKPFQLQILKEMDNREQNIFRSYSDYDVELNYGFLSLNMSSGKTLITLIHILTTPLPQPHETYKMNTGIVNFKRVNRKRFALTNLLIMTREIYENAWANDLRKIDMEIRTLIIDSSTFDISNVNFDDYHIVFYLYDSKNTEIHRELMNAYTFSRIIIDEAQNFDLWNKSKFGYQSSFQYYIENNDFFDCNFMWLISATPYMMYRASNHITKNLLRICDFNHRDDYPEYFMKNFIAIDPKIVADQMNIISSNFTTLNVKPSKFIRGIEDLISDEAKRLFAEERHEDAVKAMGFDPKCGTSPEQFFEQMIDKRSRRIEGLKMQAETSLKSFKNNLIDKKEHDTTVLKLNDEIEKLMHEITRFESQRERITKDDDCMICFEPFNASKFVCSECNNCICTTCSSHVMNSRTVAPKCPACRRKFPHEARLDLLSGNAFYRATDAFSNKNEALANVLERDFDKVLLYMYTDDDFNPEKIMTEIHEAGYTPIYSKDNITESINEFKDTPRSVMIIDAINSGSGLNLQFADALVVFSEYPDETQIIGRVERYGREKPCEIFMLKYQR